MTIRKVTGAIVVVAIVALVTAATAVAHKTGRYEGTTSQGHAIGFSAKKQGVKKFAFTHRVACDDGAAYQLTDPSGGRSPVKENGRFKAVFTSDMGTGIASTTVLRGRLKRKTASGSIHAEGTTATGASCEGSADWSAQKK